MLARDSTLAARAKKWQLWWWWVLNDIVNLFSIPVLSTLEGITYFLEFTFIRSPDTYTHTKYAK